VKEPAARDSVLALLDRDPADVTDAEPVTSGVSNRHAVGVVVAALEVVVQALV
jgi:hypothetical protein